jgi:iron complex outermembrane receptor protein
MRKLAYLAGALANVALLVAAAPLPAQEDSADPPAEEEPTVEERDVLFVEESLPFLPSSNTIATKLPVETAWTPAHVGVVDLAVMKEQEARVLGDALENVSGLNVQTGNGIFDFFVVRGFDSLSSGLILTDGAPEPEVTFYQLYNAERIEVFKGPAGFLYGSNPLAGVVNLVRKQPVPANFGSVDVSVGSWETFEGSLDWNRTRESGKASFRLNGLWRESDGYRDGRESEIAGINPAFSWQPSDRTSINLNLELLESDIKPDAGLPLLRGEVPDIPRSRSFASPFDFSEQSLERFQLDVETRFSDRLALRNKTYSRGLDWSTAGTQLLGVIENIATTDVLRVLFLLDDEQIFLGNQLEAVYTVETGSVVHNLLAGLELARFADEFSLDGATLPFIDLYDPVETARLPLDLNPQIAAAGDSRSIVIAPYLVDHIELSERVRVLAGARYDSIDFEDDLTQTSRSDGEWSPLLGVVVSPVPGFSLYANAARSFAPPSPRVAGERKPEESRQLELGLRKELCGGRVQSSFAVFEIERENIAIPDDNGFTQQAGDQRARGLEAELAARLGAGLRLWLAYAHTDSELTRFTEQIFVGFPRPFPVTVDRSGNRSAFSPKNLLNLRLSLPLGRLDLAAGLRFVDEQFIAEDNLVELDSYRLLDAALSYGLQDWRLTLHLHNLTDEDYETRGFGSSAVIPGEPFSVSLAVEYRL